MNSFHLPTHFLKTLAHPERLRLLYALRGGEECVCHLTALLRRRQAYVSQQLGFLRQAGLIADRQAGLRVYYRVTDARIFALLDAANALTGAKNIAAEARTLAACPCPKCAAKQSDRAHGKRKNSRRKQC
ncbi:MAG: winged helix-turn-helix transcriptional regulator [Chloroflexi bacterium]|nr:winged helix-turn-helix transcriptional regulator [Chloroflexota bacterium]